MRVNNRLYDLYTTCSPLAITLSAIAHHTFGANANILAHLPPGCEPDPCIIRNPAETGPVTRVPSMSSLAVNKTAAESSNLADQHSYTAGRLPYLIMVPSGRRSSFFVRTITPFCMSPLRSLAVAATETPPTFVAAATGRALLMTSRTTSPAASAPFKGDRTTHRPTQTRPTSWGLS